MREFKFSWLVATVALAAPLALVASSPSAATYDSALETLHAAAKKEGKVVMYGDQSVELIQKLGDAFEKRFPGVDFDFFRGDSTQVMQRFESETVAKRHNLDMLMSTDRRLTVLLEKGWLQQHDWSVAKVYPQGIQPANGSWYIYCVSTGSFAYNTELVKATDVPQTWDDLLDPKWRGRIGMQDPKSGGGGAHSWLVRMHGLWGEEKWRGYIDSMGKQITKYGRYFPIREALTSGEIAIQFVAYPDFTEPLKQKGAPIEWSATPDPILFIGLGMGVSKFAPHPNAAKLLLEFLMMDEAQ